LLPESRLRFTSVNNIMSMSIQDAGQVREGFPRPFPNTPSNVLDQFRMAGKVVVVTGAADGIGLAVTEAMAEAGANVVLWYNSYVMLP
jgi:3-oxoacyl-ACP reductase-like protein